MTCSVLATCALRKHADNNGKDSVRKVCVGRYHRAYANCNTSISSCCKIMINCRTALGSKMARRKFKCLDERAAANRCAKTAALRSSNVATADCRSSSTLWCCGSRCWLVLFPGMDTMHLLARVELMVMVMILKYLLGWLFVVITGKWITTSARASRCCGHAGFGWGVVCSVSSLFPFFPLSCTPHTVTSLTSLHVGTALRLVHVLRLY